MTGLVRGLPAATRSPDLALSLPDSWAQHIETTTQSRAFVELIMAEDWSALSRDVDLLTYVNNHCVLCARWLGRPQDMRMHLVGDHGLPWTPITARGIQLTALYGHQQPCQLCAKSVRTVAAVIQLFALTPPRPTVPMASADATAFRTCTPIQCPAGQPVPTLHALTCLLCHQSFDAQHQLRTRLTDQHQLANWDWNAARDSMAGAETCAHCLTLMESMDCLRQHVDATQPTEPRPIPVDMRLAVEGGDW